MMGVTVACVWVRGHVPYGVEYVARLRSLVGRALARPFRFVCLTDRPTDVPAGVEGLRITPTRGIPGWWSKIELFAPRRFSGRVLYLDLDTLIVASLDPIVEVPAPFALIPDAGQFRPPAPHRVVKRFNSSVMVWDADYPSPLYQCWTPAAAEEFWGDQDYIGHTWPDAATMPLAWFPRLSAIGPSGIIPPDAKVILSKKPKNVEAAKRWPWFAERWCA